MLLVSKNDFKEWCFNINVSKNHLNKNASYRNVYTLEHITSLYQMNTHHIEI